VGIYLGRLIAIAISIAYSNSNSNRIAAGHSTAIGNSYIIAIALPERVGQSPTTLEGIRFIHQIKPNEELGSRADFVNRVGQTRIRKVYSTFVLAVSNAE
jgi:carotenoid cleavage dioxygenase-like enzyme